MSNLNHNATENQITKKRPFHFRSLTSLLLTAAFLIMLFSGVMLYLTPRGKDAYWNAWTMLGLSKEQWTSLHVNMSLLFAIIAIVHLVYNWKVFWNYLKSKAISGINRKAELTVTLVISTAVIVGCVAELPPFQSIMNINSQIKDYWEARSDSAPMPHAEMLPLGVFAAKIGVNPPEMMQLLTEEGFSPERGMTVKEAADQKNMSPNEFMELILDKIPGAQMPGDSDAGPELPETDVTSADLPMGQFAAQIGVNPPEMMQLLRDEGFDPKPGMTVRQLAEQQQMTPKEFVEMIREKMQPHAIK